MSKKLLKLVLICLTSLTVNTKAREEKSKFKISADLVSRYVWRGKQFSASPAIQPTIEGHFGNLNIGA